MGWDGMGWEGLYSLDGQSPRTALFASHCMLPGQSGHDSHTEGLESSMSWCGMLCGKVMPLSHRHSRSQWHTGPDEEHHCDGVDRLWHPLSVAHAVGHDASHWQYHRLVHWDPEQHRHRRHANRRTDGDRHTHAHSGMAQGCCVL